MVFQLTNQKNIEFWMVFAIWWWQKPNELEGFFGFSAELLTVPTPETCQDWFFGFSICMLDHLSEDIIFPIMNKMIRLIAMPCTKHLL